MKSMKAGKFSAVLLTVVLMAALFVFMATPLSVWADGECAITASGDTSILGDYSTLDDALAAIDDNTQTTIKLYEGVTYTGGCSLSNKDITFDLNGYDLVFNSADGGAALDLTDCIIDYTGSGSFQVSGSGNSSTGLHIDGGSCELTSAESSGVGSRAVLCNNSPVTNDTATVIVNGNVTASGDSDVVGVMAKSASLVTVTGKISATCDSDGPDDPGAIGIFAFSASVVNAGGDVTAKSVYDAVGVLVENDTIYDNKTIVNVSGSVTASGSNSNGVYAPYDGTEVNIDKNVTATGEGSKGVITGDNGATVIVKGSVTAPDAGSTGINAYSGGSVTVGGDVTGDDGVDAASGAVVNVGGDVIAYGDGIYGVNAINEGTAVTVDGNVAITGNYSTGVYVDDSATVIIGATGGAVTGGLIGNVSAKEGDGNTGVNASNNGKITVNGCITIVGDYSTGIAASTGATVDVECNDPIAYPPQSVIISGMNSTCIYAYGGAVVTAHGAVFSSGDNSTGVDASSGATITVYGDVSTNGDSSTGANATTADTTVRIKGSVTAIGVYSAGVSAYTDASVNVDGSVSAPGDGSTGIFAYDGATVAVGANVTGDDGIDAASGATVSVTRNVKANGDGIYGVYATDGGTTVDIGGNVVVTGNYPIGAYADTGAEITISGFISSNGEYVIAGGNNKTPSDFTTPSTKTGYLTYTDGVSTVWVGKALTIAPTNGSNGGSSSASSQTSGSPQTGDSANPILWIVLAAACVIISARAVSKLYVPLDKAADQRN